MSNNTFPGEPDVWSNIRDLVERAPSLPDLRSHGLHLIAARTWRQAGRTVPDELARQELYASWRVHVADELLRMIADVVDQDIVVLKGIAVAGHYPERTLRPFGDLDLLVADPQRAQRQLMRAGFRHVSRFEDGFFDGHHHLEPLELPGRETLEVEIHSQAPWVHWCPPPSFEQLRRRSRPGPVPGIWFPDPLDHALVLACHSWHSLPLRRALDLVDIALVIEGLDRSTLAGLARRWQVSRLWGTMLAVCDALTARGANSLPLRVWARDLQAIRECSVFERHLRTWFAPFWVRPPHLAAFEALRAIGVDLRPIGDEGWPEKLARIRRGVQHPLRPIGDHDRELGPSARRLRPPHRRSSGPSERPVRGAGHTR